MNRVYKDLLSSIMNSLRKKKRRMVKKNAFKKMLHALEFSFFFMKIAKTDLCHFIILINIMY